MALSRWTKGIIVLMQNQLNHGVLRSRISEAFASVTYPAQPFGPEPYHFDLSDFLDLAKERHWTNIDQEYETLAWTMGELPPELFHFYLPGFLLYSAKQFFQSDVVDNLLYSFTPPVQPEDSWQRTRFEQRLLLLTAPQKAVAAFYWKMARDQGAKDWLEEEIVRSNFWEQFLS